MEHLTAAASICTASATTEQYANMAAPLISMQKCVRKNAWELIPSTTWKERNRYPQPDGSASPGPDIFGPDIDELTGPEPHADYADDTDCPSDSSEY